MQKKVRMLFGSGGPYIVFALCLLAAGVLGYQFFVPQAAAPDPAQSEIRAEPPELTEIPERYETPEIPEVPVTVTEEETAEEVSSSEEVEIPVAEAPAVPSAALVPKLRTPLEGKTIASFSSEVLSYNEALEDWRTHNGVDIAAEEGTPVCAAADGEVLSVEEDPLMGVTVVLSHSGGYTSTYACLGTEVYVSAGDSVLAGQNIGAVGTTAAGESAEPHLHFSVSKDGRLVDPAEYLN